MCLTEVQFPHISVSSETWVNSSNLNRLLLREKHTHIERDHQLLKAIRRAIHAELVMDQRHFHRMLFTKLFFYVGAALATYSGIYLIENPFAFTFCFILYGYAILLLAFNFAHDFSHGTVFKASAWNDIGFILIYALNGAHAEAWKKRHIESHHFAPNVEHYDSDLEISNLIRVIPNSSHQWLHRFQHLYAPLAYTTYSLYWVFIKDFYIFFWNTPRKSMGYFASFVMQKVFYFGYLVVLPLLLSNQPWQLVIVAFTAMHLCQSLFLLFTFFMTHHVEGVEYPVVDQSGLIKTSWVMNQIKSSNDMYPFSKTANFIFGGFNNHVAHHLFPQVHHVYYPALNVILYKVLREHDITPNHTTYWEGICSHLRLLKRMSLAQKIA